MLTPSSADMLAYVRAVYLKAQEIFEKLARRDGMIPVSNEFILNRRRMLALIARYKSGDLRHSELEEGAVEYIARWCIEKWGELTNTEPNQFIPNKRNLDARHGPKPTENPFAPVRYSTIAGPDGRPLKLN